MLELKVKEKEFFDTSTNKFIQIPECTLTLEHSLMSLAKWEAKWKIPYYDTNTKTPVQDLDYIRCMVVGTVKNEAVFQALEYEDIMKIQEYMADPMTATTFKTNAQKTKQKREIMTAELIYSHMFAHSIPIECQKWHLNRLLTLIKVCNLQSGPKEKMTKKQTTQWNAEQNAARRAKYNTRG